MLMRPPPCSTGGAMKNPAGLSFSIRLPGAIEPPFQSDGRIGKVHRAARIGEQSHLQPIGLQQIAGGVDRVSVSRRPKNSAVKTSVRLPIASAETQGAAGENGQCSAGERARGGIDQ